MTGLQAADRGSCQCFPRTLKGRPCWSRVRSSVLSIQLRWLHVYIYGVTWSTNLKFADVLGTRENEIHQQQGTLGQSG